MSFTTIIASHRKVKVIAIYFVVTVSNVFMELDKQRLNESYGNVGEKMAYSIFAKIAKQLGVGHLVSKKER